MVDSKTDYYDENNNYLFVRKGDNDNLLDYVFVHFDDSRKTGFFAHFESYEADEPLRMFIFEKVLCPNIPTNEMMKSEFEETQKEQIWKRVRVHSILPSQWRMFFESFENQLKANNDNS